MQRLFYCLIAACAALQGQVAAQVGTLVHKAGSLDNGYVLMAPLGGTTTYLIDKCGRVMHSWPSAYRPQRAAYLLDDGSIIRGGALPPGGGNPERGLVERIDWDGRVVWTYTPDSTIGLHHDLEPLPNGNVLVIGSEPHSANEAMARGADPALAVGSFISEQVLELKPVGHDSAQVVWEWHAWDHIVQDHMPDQPNFGTVADHPEHIDINYRGSSFAGWLHFNAIRYNAELDQIMISCHNFNELWIIDHSTTKAEAQSHSGGLRNHGGDLLYRWGNPAAYERGTGSSQVFFGQHDATWIPRGFPHAGKIMVFNNGLGRPDGNWASVDIISPPIDKQGNYNDAALPLLPDTLAWRFTDSPPEKIYSPIMCGVRMQENGSLLITQSMLGTLSEVDTNRRVVWLYINPVSDTGIIEQGPMPQQNAVFRSVFYPRTHPALRSRVLTAGRTIEAHPLNPDCTLYDTATSVADNSAFVASTVAVFPNPTHDLLTVAGGRSVVLMTLYSAMGAKVAEVTNANVLATDAVATGVYCLVINDGRHVSTRMVTVVR